MRPVLFELFGIPFHTWGLSAALAFCVVAAVAFHLAKRATIDSNRVADLLFYGAIFGLIGARIAYYLTHPNELTSLGDFLNPRRGGASMYGAAVCIFPLFFWLCSRYNIHPKNMADVFAPGLVLGLAIHRFGCLGAGCCYGLPMSVERPWGVSMHGAIRHPTQLYEAFPLVVLGVGLWIFWSKRRFLGDITWHFALIYTPIRIVGEFFRGSPDRGFVIESLISVGQVATVIFFIIAWIWLRQKPAELTPAQR